MFNLLFLEMPNIIILDPKLNITEKYVYSYLNYLIEHQHINKFSYRELSMLIGLSDKTIKLALTYLANTDIYIDGSRKYISINQINKFLFSVTCNIDKALQLSIAMYQDKRKLDSRFCINEKNPKFVQNFIENIK